MTWRNRRRDPVGPLRRVVGVSESPYGARIETLECGHTYRPRQGHQPMNAARRRCPKCPSQGGD